jgi:hypothetical protein
MLTRLGLRDRLQAAVVYACEAGGPGNGAEARLPAARGKISPGSRGSGSRYCGISRPWTWLWRDSPVVVCGR